MIWEERLDRFAYLITKLDDENAAWIVLSLEGDRLVANSLLSDLLYGSLDKTADSIYSMYVMSGVSIESVEKAINFLKAEYDLRKLPTDLSPATMMSASQIVEYYQQEYGDEGPQI